MIYSQDEIYKILINNYSHEQFTYFMRSYEFPNSFLIKLVEDLYSQYGIHFNTVPIIDIIIKYQKINKAFIEKFHNIIFNYTYIISALYKRNLLTEDLIEKYWNQIFKFPYIINNMINNGELSLSFIKNHFEYVKNHAYYLTSKTKTKRNILLLIENLKINYKYYYKE